jgi:hypothetical protein
MKKDSKQRLLEVMQRVAPNFEGKILKESSIPAQQPEPTVNVIAGEQQVSETKHDINPKYTHFAVLKSTGKIFNGWDYPGYDPAELRAEKKYYFFNDIKDIGVDPKLVTILTRKKLESQGINPFDKNNWADPFKTVQSLVYEEPQQGQRGVNLAEILNSYLETALWADGDEHEFDGKTINDIDTAAKAKAINDIGYFLSQARKIAPEELATYDSKGIGHNLWLSRNGHGAGFFDDNNDKLQDIARNMHTKTIYTGDNGRIYID